MIDFTKWSNNTSCQRIMETDYQNYIIQFSPIEVDLLDTLLSKLDFYDNEKCMIYFEKYARFLGCLADSNPSALFFLPVKDNKPHNSHRMFSILKKESRKHGDCFYGNYYARKGDYLFNTATKIFVIDDFSGSGQTIIKMLGDINNKLKMKKDIIIAPMLITDYAEKNIMAESSNWDKLNVSFKLINNVRKAKLITKHSILNLSQLQLYEQLCAFADIKHKYGYEQTEELIAFSYYTPNNTLGLLWESPGYVLPFLNRDGNEFAFTTDELYFSKEDINILKSFIKNDINSINRKKSLLSMFLLLGLSKDRILSCLKIKTDGYERLIQSCINSKIIEKHINKYQKGKKFNNFIDDEVFTRLTCLNQNFSRKQKIDKNFLNTLLY